MKNLRLTSKLVFLLNSVLATLLLLSYVLPFVPPKNFALLSVLSLGVPLLIIINALFFLYWLLRVKKQMLLSLSVLVMGYVLFGSLYKFSSASKSITPDLTVMSYNVRLFNLYNWTKDDGTTQKITQVIKDNAPDVLAIQDYRKDEKVDLSLFKYKHEVLRGKAKSSGQAIFSQYPIVNSGSLEFPKTINNAIFADIEVDEDTVRIYSVHLQSHKIDADIEKLKNENSERLLKRMANTFEKQQFQTELFLMHKKQCPYKMIVMGDFNNSAFSYVYKEIKGNLKDAFKVAGNGFGRTYDFKFFPLRIDFILTDPTFKILRFKTLDNKLSDHYPILAKLKLE